MGFLFQEVSLCSQLLPTPLPGYGCAHTHARGLPWCALSQVPVVSVPPSCVLSLMPRSVPGGPPRCALSPMLPMCDRCPPSPRGSTRQLGGEETGTVAAGEFPKLPPSVFFFLRKSSCSILLLHTRKGLSSHTLNPFLFLDFYIYNSRIKKYTSPYICWIQLGGLCSLLLCEWFFGGRIFIHSNVILTFSVFFLQLFYRKTSFFFQLLGILWARFLEKECLLMPIYGQALSLMSDVVDSCGGGSGRGRVLIGAVVGW